MTKADQLRQLIRKMVKEEVTAEVNRAMGKVLVEMVKEIKKPTKPIVESQEEPEEVTEEAEVTAPILKTANPKLNSVLAETARNFKPLPKTDEGVSLTDLMDGGFEKIGQNETVELEKPKTKIDFLKQMITESAVPAAPSVLDNTAELPPGLKKLFKKDFKGILELSKKKQGGYSPNVSMG